MLSWAFGTNLCSGKCSNSFGCAVTTADPTGRKDTRGPTCQQTREGSTPLCHTSRLHHPNLQSAKVAESEPPPFEGTRASQRGGRHHVREFERVTEDLAHRSGGACAGDRPAGGSLQLERKGLKEVGRGGTIRATNHWVYQWCFV